MSQTPTLQESSSEPSSQHQIPKIRSLEQERQLMKFAKSESTTPRGLNASNLNFNPGRAVNNSQLIISNEGGVSTLKKSQYALVEDLENRWESIKQQTSMAHSGFTTSQTNQGGWVPSASTGNVVAYPVAPSHYQSLPVTQTSTYAANGATAQTIYQAPPMTLLNQELMSEGMHKHIRFVGESPQPSAINSKMERNSPGDFYNVEKKSGRLSVGQQDLQLRGSAIAMINKGARGNASSALPMYSSQVCGSSNALLDGNRSRSGSPGLREQQIKSKDALMQTPVNTREQRMGNADKNSAVSLSNNFNGGKGPLPQNLIKKVVPHSKIDLASVCLFTNDPRGNLEHLNQSPGPQSNTVSPQRNSTSSLTAKLSGRASINTENNQNVQGTQSLANGGAGKSIKSSSSMTSTASIKKSCLKEKLPLPSSQGVVLTSNPNNYEKYEQSSLSTQKKPKSLKESTHLKAIFDKYSNVSHKKSPDLSQIGKILKMNDQIAPLNEKENNENKLIPVVSRINSNNLSNLTMAPKTADNNSPKKAVPQPIAPSALPQPFKEKAVLSERDLNISFQQQASNNIQNNIVYSGGAGALPPNPSQRSSIITGIPTTSGGPPRSVMPQPLSNSQIIPSRVEARVFHHQRQTSNDSTSKGKLEGYNLQTGVKELENGIYAREENLFQRPLGDIRSNPPMAYTFVTAENRPRQPLANSRIAFKENISQNGPHYQSKNLKDSSLVQDKILSIFNLNDHGLTNHTPLFAEANMKFN